MNLVKNSKFYTQEEYFKIEEQEEFKSEYFEGEIFAMAGGTPNHNRIILNVAGSLNSEFKIKNKACESFASDVRVEIEQDKHYVYPDVFVICGDLEFAQNRRDTITNPILIVEVLSDSTKDYDRGSKFTSYRKIKTLKDYLLIDQKNIHIEYFFKQDSGIWGLKEYFSLTDTISLYSIQVDIVIKEIYNRVDI
ncbi:MAG: Uma2 family endonuclease [Desulfobacterales bacterium]|nr:Uma2 family endonuclease [Desulfobacterales bacterium]